MPRLMLTCRNVHSLVLFAVYLLTLGEKYTRLDQELTEVLSSDTQVSSCLQSHDMLSIHRMHEFNHCFCQRLEHFNLK